MGDLTKNFNRSEFACKDGCGRDGISIELVKILQESRDAVGIPFTIESGVRCEKHNAAEGGEQNSAHLTGLAVDILCPNSHARYLMLKDLVKRVSRIGIGKTFIHVDIDKTKPPEVAWLY